MATEEPASECNQKPCRAADPLVPISPPKAFAAVARSTAVCVCLLYEVPCERARPSNPMTGTYTKNNGDCCPCETVRPPTPMPSRSSVNPVVAGLRTSHNRLHQVASLNAPQQTEGGSTHAESTQLCRQRPRRRRGAGGARAARGGRGGGPPAARGCAGAYLGSE